MGRLDDKPLDRCERSGNDSARLPRRDWSWDQARQRLDGLPNGNGLNIAYEAVDRHVANGRGDALAFVFLTSDDRREVTYAELEVRSDRLAGAFSSLGIHPGDTVFSLMGRRYETYLTALAALKAGAIFSPLFSTFGPEPVRSRLDLGNARMLVTTSTLFERKVRELLPSLPDLQYVVIVDGDETSEPTDSTAHVVDFSKLLENGPPDFEIVNTDSDSPALLHFTSGTTGTPKGALHVHEAIVAHDATARFVLDLGPDDVYWCTADPGWVTGISYGLIAPLSVGATAIVDQEEFGAERWYETLERERVNVWYTAPTAIRMMMRLGTAAARERAYPDLRRLASVGEPLEPDAVKWGAEAFGRPFSDTWWQTETGAIMIASDPGTDVRPGSMGRPLPAIEAAAVRRDRGKIEVVDDPAEVGELALREGWPSMFRAYVGDPLRYQESFADGWYLSGDLVRRDEDGYFWFVGRADDAIQSAGHLIGPFEVERVMMEHPAVADAAAVGKPDPIAFEIVTVALVLEHGERESDELRAELRAHARRRLGPAVAPREISFHSELPKTPSGKTIRRALRAKDLPNGNRRDC